MINLKTIIAESKLKMSIPSDIKKLYKLFKKNGKQLYVVGGAVRDAILGKTPKDFDLTTDASPEEVQDIAKQGNYNADLVGKSFGVVIVNGHEIATFRKDIGKGRRPDAVEFTPDIKQDVKRRDLTVNALYYDIGKGNIVDVVGGIKDLQKRQARTVGDPERRFLEDPLRKLRAVRFAGVLGGKMHKDTWESLKKNPDLSGISGERIRDEFIKGIKKSKSPQIYLKMITKLGMWKWIFPGLKVNTKFWGWKDYIVQIAILLNKNSVIANVKNKLNSLKYHNQETNDIWFLQMLASPNEWAKDNLPAVKNLQKNTRLSNKQIKMWAQSNPKYLKTIMKVWKWKLSVTAKDAVDKGLKGKDIGDYIRNRESELFKL